MKPILLLIAGTIVFGLVTTIGIFFNLIESVYKSIQWKFWLGICHFFKYWWHLIKEVYNAVSYLFIHIAIGFDLIGNASGGKMIEQAVTEERDTLYGKGKITISAATGKVEVDGKLNKEGAWLTWALTKVLGNHHSVNAYLSELNASKTC